MHKKQITLLSALLAFCGFAQAEAPTVPNPGPYIVLSQNLDEPNGYGFCIDTLGRGKSDLVQTHTCKPEKEGVPRDYQDNDARFSYDKESGQVKSWAFEGHCMQVLMADGWNVFALLECSDHPRQQFVFNSGDRTLRLNEDQSLCVIVDSKTQPAGPWVKRPLKLENCEKTEASLKQWTVKGE
ncbi:Ricin-type beta-trefoil lectin domain protein [Grimontia celer]|uniref:Ricin-type beta-trefoil lectin domain protein n=1 Tax=Grimontia celer TaxID=1796497 RepID=A0A128F330_9GAMM|nr:hypothetical protein [Grimontia celer]CZF81179.1 Ricin-type beta-trefoil lectin domain protein [Grimontia celer]